jgi:transposase InsO family protein
MTRVVDPGTTPEPPRAGTRPGTPLLQQDAERLIQHYVDHYNNVRLLSAIGYVTPMDMLARRRAAA